jgi:hypothetical protein
LKKMQIIGITGNLNHVHNVRTTLSITVVYSMK